MSEAGSKEMVPAIRFEGFDGAWLERPLHQLSDVIDGDRGHNYPSGDDLRKSGHTLFLSATNVTRNGFRFEKTEFISKTKSNSMGNGKIELNDIILTSRGSIGHVALYNAMVEKFFPYSRINSGMLILRPTGTIEPSALAQFLSSPLGKKKVDLISFGSAQPQLTKQSVSNCTATLPKDKKEQTKIGEYFQQLDALIAGHHRKREKLLQLKKSLLEKMFPKQGQDKPEIRFTGFNGDWVETELGLEVTIAMGQSPSGSCYTNNPNDHILVQGNADMRNGVVVPRVWTTQVTKTAAAGDLIFSVRAPVGQVGKTEYDIVIGRGVAAIKGNEFIFQSLKRMDKNSDWKKLSAGSTFESINSTDLSTAKLVVAPPKEQTKIGELFKHTDTLINQHQSQITKLLNIKQACLAKMFV